MLLCNLQSVTPIYDAHGTLTHYVGIQSDITELVNHRRAELAARHAALQVGTNDDCQAQAAAATEAPSAAPCVGPSILSTHARLLPRHMHHFAPKHR